MKGYNYIPNKFFKKEKLKCQKTGKYFFDEEFLADLIDIRECLGFGMIVSSGYRDKTHPIEAKKILQGKEPGSHCAGRAIDIKIRGNKAYDLLVECLARDFRVGVSQHGKHRFIHIDNMGTKNGDPVRFSNKLWS